MIVLPSAKTMKKSDVTNTSTPIFENKAKAIRTEIAQMDKDQLANYFKVKGKTLDNTHGYYQEPQKGKVVTSLDGAVFKQIEPSNDEYIKDNLYVLDAMYGILNGNDQIDLFRLDFNLKSVFDQSYYNYWKEDVHNFINNTNHDQLLILTSDEYTKLLKLDQINKQIFEIEFDSEIKSSVHKKQARGKIANYCIANTINDYSKLNGVQIDEYQLKVEQTKILVTRV